LARVSVVIPTHDSLSWVDACLSSVLAQDGVDSTVAVVDNGSSDGTVEHVARRWPSVALIALTDNVGYGAAINEGARALPRGHILALNADTTLGPGSLCKLVAVLEADGRVGAVAPRLLNPDRTLQPTAHRFPTLTRLLGEALALDRLPVLGRAFDYHCRNYDYDRAREIDWATGTVLLIRQEAWETVGGFDPAYFFFVEEIDLQRRLTTEGWRIVLAPAAVAVHHGGKKPIAPDLFLHSHAGFERYFALTSGRGTAGAARAVLCLTALTRALGWILIALIDVRRREKGRRWASMFIRVFLRSAFLLARIPRERHAPYIPSKVE
jgi:N-acetylglucosaminyl-diphospho-decaprenol L-rhamnosyltransferase